MYVKQLKSAMWRKLLVMLGKQGDQIMLDLLLDCGIYVSIGAGKGNFYQLSGQAGRQYSFRQIVGL